MRRWIWSGIGALALALLAAPAHAGKAIVVDWKAALVYPLDDGELVRGPLITNNGKVLKPRHLGTFRISEKLVDKRSNMYNKHGKPIQPGEEGARMPYWMRLGGTAQGFHQSSLFNSEGPRHRSNGCYRLSRETAKWLFSWAPKGTPVYVVSDVCVSKFAWLGNSRCERAAAPATAKKPAVAVAPPATRSTVASATAVEGRRRTALLVPARAQTRRLR
ncbi:MAG: L,D-transpeptidase [Armatimonadetes bacterium]|nr:L,D-transpeptidase [Armatimonadota bacterium]